MDAKFKPIDIEFQNLTYSVKIKKHTKNVLKNISGDFKSGELTAIMGPSGAGKSSLLNILTGFIREGVTGDINIHNREKRYRKTCSYILQDDNLYPKFTLQETMLIAAGLKIANLTINEKQTIIDNILNTLNLYETKNTMCGKLSGGQKKRLSIALELLDNPPILFLDEPTTGLDSLASSHCISLLHNLARDGRTIICTIHQPSAPLYQMFDHIYVLSDGHCVYQGTPNNTVIYLRTIGLQCPQYHNPADFVIEVANGEYGNYTAQLTEKMTNAKIWRENKISEFDINDNNNNNYNNNNNHQKNRLSKISIDSKETYHVPSEYQKLYILLGRCRIHYYRDWTVTHLKLLLHILCAILISLMYGDSGINASKAISNIGLLVIGIVYLWYTTVMPGVLKFPTEISIIRKETFNNWYKLRTYFIATMITTTPIHIVFSTVYATIIFLLTSQPLEINRYVQYSLVYILTTIVADGIGLTLGSSLNPVNGTFIGGVLSAFKLLFCGFLVFWHHIPKFLSFLTHISTLSYSLEALVVSIYGYNRTELHCPEEELYCHYKSSNLLIKELGMNSRNYTYDVLMLFGQCLLIKMIAYIMLKRRIKCNY